MSVNKVILVGNVGRDAEVATTNNGTQYAKFSIATTEYFKGKDGQRQENTEWHNVIIWGTQAANAGNFVKKGRKIYVEGRLQSSEYEDKNGGGKRRSWDINANTFVMLDKNPASANGDAGNSAPAATSNAAAPAPVGSNVMNDNDDLPF